MLALFIAIVGLAAGLASTVPPAFSSLAAIFPTAPALQMLRAAAAGDMPSAWAGLAGCVVFALVFDLGPVPLVAT